MPRVLLVEDSAADVELVRAAMDTDPEFALEVSTSLEDARNRLQREAFDAVLGDSRRSWAFGPSREAPRSSF